MQSHQNKLKTHSITPCFSACGSRGKKESKNLFPSSSLSALPDKTWPCHQGHRAQDLAGWLSQGEHVQYFLLPQGPNQTFGRGRQWKADWPYRSEGKAKQNTELLPKASRDRVEASLWLETMRENSTQVIREKSCKGFVIQVKAHHILPGTPAGADTKQEEH